jgi:hypothetical protein
MSNFPLPENVKAFDLLLSQCIERYRDMSYEEAYVAIYDEWPQQMAVILETAFFKPSCHEIRRFFELERTDGSRTIIFVPF